MKIISGGQTGVDQAALRAAKKCGLERGGWLPHGCMTLEGPRPDLLEEHNMKEHPKPGYPPRTSANVQDSDGTLRIAHNFGSPGERCTLREINRFDKVHLDVYINKLPHPEEVVNWIRDNNIEILNVAGNAEQTCPGIGKLAEEFLIEVFGEVWRSRNEGL